jgi:MFS family permease
MARPSTSEAHTLLPTSSATLTTTTSSSNRSSPHKHANQEPVTWLSLPHKTQLLILALCRLSEPLSNTCLLPYVYYLMRSLQTTLSSPPLASVSSAPSPATSSTSSISRQGSLLVALFALSQFATSMPWAWFANKYGRKTSILLGLSLSIVANLGFGFSTDIWSIFLWRLVAGIGNGNVGVMRTMTAEIVTERKYQGRAFLLLPLVFNSGVVVGLALGGLLADPVRNLPSVCGREGWLNFGGGEGGVQWMVRWPFALPTMFNAAVLSGSLLLAVCGLKETMPGLKEKKDKGLVVGRVIRRLVQRILFGRLPGYMALRSDDLHIMSNDDNSESGHLRSDSVHEKPAHNNPPPPTGPTWTKDVINTLISFTLLPLHNSAFMNLFPIFLSSPPAPADAPAASSTHSLIHFTGGLSLPSSTIGLFCSFFGIFGIAIQLLVYPRLQSRIGTLAAYKLALALFVPAYALAPYLSLLSTSGIGRQHLAIAVVLCMQVTARTFAIPSSVILLTNSSPHPSKLGSIHGAGNMVQSLARAVGPAVGGWIYAHGVEMGAVGVVWWVYLAAVAGCGLWWSWRLREGEARRAGVEMESDHAVGTKRP